MNSNTPVIFWSVYDAEILARVHQITDEEDFDAVDYEPIDAEFNYFLPITAEQFLAKITEDLEAIGIYIREPYITLENITKSLSRDLRDMFATTENLPDIIAADFLFTFLNNDLKTIVYSVIKKNVKNALDLSTRKPVHTDPGILALCKKRAENQRVCREALNYINPEPCENCGKERFKIVVGDSGIRCLYCGVYREIFTTQQKTKSFWESRIKPGK